MYKEFFGLKEYPFQLTSDSDFLYMSKSHNRAKAYMDYTVWNNDGFMVITGEVGSGKTTLIKKLLSELDDKIIVAKIFQTQLTEEELIQAILVEFGMNPFNARKVELLDMLNTFLIEAHSKYRQTLLIIDDAHNLPVSVLEEVRMLSGLETEKEKLINVMLVGQPELNNLLELPALEQLLQRVRLRYYIRELTLEETEEYMHHRLEIAGGSSKEIFDSKVMPMIHRYTGGIPRLINTLCDTVLTCAYADDQRNVTLKMVNAAIVELRWPTYDKRKSSKQDKLSRSRLDNGSDLMPISEQNADLLVRNIAKIADKMDKLDEMLDIFTATSKNLEISSKKLTELVNIVSGQSKTNMKEVGNKR